MDKTEHFWRSEPVVGFRTLIDMYNSISRSQIFVLDQDEAVKFYVDTLGLEIASDIDLGFMRWLTVRVPGEPGREILLERPGAPAMDRSANSCQKVRWVAGCASRPTMQTQRSQRFAIVVLTSPMNHHQNPTGLILVFGTLSGTRSVSVKCLTGLPDERPASAAAAKVKGPASYFPSIERTYGEPIDHWMTIIANAATGTRKHMELVTHLKTDHGIGHGHANALVAHWLANN